MYSFSFISQYLSLSKLVFGKDQFFFGYKLSEDATSLCNMFEFFSIHVEVELICNTGYLLLRGFHLFILSRKTHSLLLRFRVPLVITCLFLL